MSDYQSKIGAELIKIEREENVRILYACESGSRAWGFPSQDSDYDVRFIYIRQVDWYLSIFNKRDVIERPINDMLDINGWDLRKALHLFRKSNPPLLEWLQSPMLYLEQFSTAERIRQLAPLTFSAKSCMFHYLNMAKGNFRMYLQGEQVKIKKYFYVLRPILACMWIEARNTMPPIAFDVLVSELLDTNNELSKDINKLLIRKKAGEELDYEPKLLVIHQFIADKITYFDKIANEQTHMTESQDNHLDELFRDALREVWNH